MCVFSPPKPPTPAPAPVVNRAAEGEKAAAEERKKNLKRKGARSTLNSSTGFEGVTQSKLGTPINKL